MKWSNYYRVVKEFRMNELDMILNLTKKAMVTLNEVQMANNVSELKDCGS